MKACRAPAPVQSSYVRIHNEKKKVQSAPATGSRKTPTTGETKKSKQIIGGGGGGVLTKFLDLDEIPDFPSDVNDNGWDNVKISSNKIYDSYSAPNISNQNSIKNSHNESKRTAWDNKQNNDDDDFPEDQYRYYDQEDDNEEDYFQSKGKTNNYPNNSNNYHSNNNYDDYENDDDDDEDEFYSKLQSSPKKPLPASGKTVTISQKVTQAPQKQNNYQKQNSQSNSSKSSSPTPPPLPYEKKENSKEISEDEKLYFSKQKRNIDFKPYTLDQYRMIKPKEYVEISKIKPDLNTDELVAKRKNLDRIKDFSKQLRQINKEIISQNPKLPSSVEQNDINLSKRNYESKRQKAIDFARNIPKPKLSTENIQSQTNNQRSESSQSNRDSTLYMDDDAIEAARLQELEARHLQNKAKMEAIKKTLSK